MGKFTLDSQMDSALSKLQDTTLTPMEEALFKAWAKANQIQKPDDPNDRIDYRGIFKVTGGHILPYGQLARFTDKLNSEDRLRELLHQRMMKHVDEVVGKKEDFEKQQFDAERKDVDHQQKMEQGQMKLKQAPYDLKMREHDIKGKEMDLHKQSMGLEQQRLGNEGKQIDLTSALLTPERNLGAPDAGTTEPRTSTSKPSAD